MQTTTFFPGKYNESPCLLIKGDSSEGRQTNYITIFKSNGQSAKFNYEQFQISIVKSEQFEYVAEEPFGYGQNVTTI